MGLVFSDPASGGEGAIHRMPAVVKFVASLILIVTIVAIPARHAQHLGWIALLLLILAMASWIPGTFILKRLLIFEPLVIGASVLAIFQPDGWRVFALLVIRSTLCLLTAILLAGTTSFTEILQVMRRARVPWLLVTTMALMHRYLFVLADESHRMRRARVSRTFAVGGHARQWRSLATIAAQLFVRASERAERVYAAMCARGWR
jgi:cobalt/nickel transport system permease protein